MVGEDALGDLGRRLFGGRPVDDDHLQRGNGRQQRGAGDEAADREPHLGRGANPERGSGGLRLRACRWGSTWEPSFGREHGWGGPFLYPKSRPPYSSWCLSTYLSNGRREYA